ncbi:MAG: UbiX family flavin prenyltransferase [Candidatus Cloacimonetes bacterium]|nr:UbiX family flavin prenyltransferase [Candidatus Cloacimonadota bacterium]
MKRIVLGITGASGAVYAKRIMEASQGHCNLDVVASPSAHLVFKEELDIDLGDLLKQFDHITVHKYKNFLSPLASGSNHFDAYIVAPCSMKTMGQIRHGIGDNLLTRVGDIAFKERRKMLLLVREAPFSTVHLENMLRISEMGAIIFPASPGFYHNPQTIDNLVDFVVGRVLSTVGLDIKLTKSWKT